MHDKERNEDDGAVKPLIDPETLPMMALIGQDIPAPEIRDIAQRLNRGFSRLDLSKKIRPGQRVALTGGSRGITDMAGVLKQTVSFLRSLGAEPYISPAMGSHGGATARGQSELLSRLGISEKTMGAPVLSSMETRNLGNTSFGLPVLVGEDFARADWVIVINRVKPHTSYRGDVESGLLKMLAIGMGKQAGAEQCHAQFFQHGFQKVVKEISARIIESLPILCGVALVENRMEKTAVIEVLDPAEFADAEPGLLSQARQLMGRVPFENVDLLIVDRMGKNISGSGMDSNVTGRIYNQATAEPPVQRFRRIYVRDLTDESDGNALGVGTADFCARRLVDKMDPVKTRINCVTATVPEKGRVPIVCESDLDGIGCGLLSAGVSVPSEARIVWIKNTLELELMKISKALETEGRKLEGARFVSRFEPFHFDSGGQLPFDCFG
jgi:hypothetical protein